MSHEPINEIEWVVWVILKYKFHTDLIENADINKDDTGLMPSQLDITSKMVNKYLQLEEYLGTLTEHRNVIYTEILQLFKRNFSNLTKTWTLNNIASTNFKVIKNIFYTVHKTLITTVEERLNAHVVISRKGWNTLVILKEDQNVQTKF